jgi:hypothetical protein
LFRVKNAKFFADFLAKIVINHNIGPWEQKYFRQNFLKNLHVLFKLPTAIFGKLYIMTLVLKKNAKNFRRKLAKIAENCKRNIDPWKKGESACLIQLQKKSYGKISN